MEFQEPGAAGRCSSSSIAAGFRRVRRLTGQHHDCVVAGEVHGLLVAHRNPGNVRHRDRFLVIRQHISRSTTDALKPAIQHCEHGRYGPIRRAITIRNRHYTHHANHATSNIVSSPRSPDHSRSHTAATSPAPSPTAGAPGDVSEPIQIAGTTPSALPGQLRRSGAPAPLSQFRPLFRHERQPFVCPPARRFCRQPCAGRSLLPTIGTLICASAHLRISASPPDAHLEQRLRAVDTQVIHHRDSCVLAYFCKPTRLREWTRARTPTASIAGIPRTKSTLPIYSIHNL